MIIDLIAQNYPKIIFFFVGIFGACIGSFAALIIYRWPRDISIVRPSSHCSVCEKKIKAWHNIPIFSWLFLRGRCAYCRNFYGFRALIIEIIFMLAAWALYVKFGLSLALVEKFGMTFLLICLAYIDLDTYTLPLSMLGLLILWGFLFSFLYYYNPHAYVPMGEALGVLKYLVLKIPRGLLADRLLGGGIGLLFFSLVNLCATWLFRHSKKLNAQQWAMGWGDPLLLMALGLFVGLTHLVLVIFLASVAGSLIGLANLLGTTPPQVDEDIAPGALPYGPFLALAALYVYLF
jgi:leader peptidase (prepilin peptidase)/N-methyltransferase